MSLTRFQSNFFYNFLRFYFFTVGKDNFLRIYNSKESNPIVLIEFKDEQVVSACWLFSNPNCVAVGTKEGSVYIYNLVKSIEKPVEKIEVSLGEGDEMKVMLISEKQDVLCILSLLGEFYVYDLKKDLEGARFELDLFYPS